MTELRQSEHMSSAARRILEDRPVLWEVLLFAQLVEDEVADCKVRIGEQPPSAETATRIDLQSVGTWIEQVLGDLTEIAARLANLINGGLQKPIEGRSLEKNSEVISELSRAVADVYLQVLTWTRGIKRTPVDPALNEIREAMPDFGDPVLRAIDAFGPEIRKEVRIAEASPPASREVTFNFAIEAPNRARFKAALERLRGTPSSLAGMGRATRSNEALERLRGAGHSNDPRAGYLYVLTNRSMPGLVKIGFTRRDPSIRTSELSRATGVPTPFKLECAVYVDDASVAERFVHEELRRRGDEVSSEREFYHTSVNEAIQVVERARAMTAS